MRVLSEISRSDNPRRSRSVLSRSCQADRSRSSDPIAEDSESGGLRRLPERPVRSLSACSSEARASCPSHSKNSTSEEMSGPCRNRGTRAEPEELPEPRLDLPCTPPVRLKLRQAEPGVGVAGIDPRRIQEALSWPARHPFNSKMDQPQIEVGRSRESGEIGFWTPSVSLLRFRKPPPPGEVHAEVVVGI